MNTRSNQPMPAATHRGCARAHTEAARCAWPGTGRLDLTARLRLAGIVARVASWPDALPPLCEAPLARRARRARPDPARYPYTIALTGATLADADAETATLDSAAGGDHHKHQGNGHGDARDSRSALYKPTRPESLTADDQEVSCGNRQGHASDDDAARDIDDGMVLGWRHERVCEALWYYVRVVLPELEMHPRAPGSADYDPPDRVRLMAFVDPASADAGADGPIMLAYGFATAWEAGARERTAAFLAARQKRRAHLSPRPLARTGWLSARGLKAAAGIPHPRLTRDPSLARRTHRAVHRFDSDEDDDNDDDGFYVTAGKALRASDKAVRFRDDSDLLRPRDRLRDPYDTYDTPAVLWHRRNPPPAGAMQIEELDDSDDDDDTAQTIGWPPLDRA